VAGDWDAQSAAQEFRQKYAEIIRELQMVVSSIRRIQNLKQQVFDILA
jgi:hypothetical protein